MSASKAQSQKIFEKLKLKPANKVRTTHHLLPNGHHPAPDCHSVFWPLFADASLARRYASTANPRTRPGRPYLSVFTCALIAPPIIATSVSTSPLFAPRISIVCTPWRNPTDDLVYRRTEADTILTEWQWEQLRVMKVGGNESATKYFQSHGGSAALASKDVKVKYTSNAAVKYKDELKRRAAADAQQSVILLPDCLFLDVDKS